MDGGEHLECQCTRRREEGGRFTYLVFIMTLTWSPCSSVPTDKVSGAFPGSNAPDYIITMVTYVRTRVFKQSTRIQNYHKKYFYKSQKKINKYIYIYGYFF